MKNLLFGFIVVLLLVSCKNETDKATENSKATAEEVEKEMTSQDENFEVIPISHASMVLNWNDKTIYVDPVGGAETYATYPLADLILITDIHGDHMSIETLQGLNTEKAKIIVPQAVADSLPSDFDTQIDVLNNGDTKERFGFNIEAIPMYNLRSDALRFHPKGRGNGYVVENDGKRIYISGDTEDIPEMRALENIDKAFVCMNLPYTMTEMKAGDAVAEFKPKTVYPYHYRGADGFSNLDLFEVALRRLDTAKQIEIVRLNWYPVK
ncbi:MAG: MBL fold metallo-hydrolase [Flavobacteriaceae bacterium]|nr:MBL fold metallo-hydrolase [Flavobacteriaceae bacterium]